MPIYEYECPVCGRFEVMQKISEVALEACPSCQSAGRQSSVQRIVSASAFHLKGSGWYKTDYSSNNGSAKDKGANKKDEGSKVASPEGKSETKSESKSEAVVAETKSTKSDGGSSSGSGGCGGGCSCH